MPLINARSAFKPATALPPIKVGSATTFTAASKKPDKIEYCLEPGVKNTSAAPRPTVQAEPLIVPRTCFARSA